MNDQQEAQRRRKTRRQQRRIVAIVGFVLFTTGMAWFFEAQSTTTVLVTRYADPAANSGSDSGLSPRGERRSEELARMLADIDVVAGIDAVFVTPARAARDTSLKLAMHSQAPVHTVENPADTEALVASILAEYKGKIVLVITEPELIQPLIADMHGSKKLPPIAKNEYDNLYIVSIPWFGKVKTLRLRYGTPSVVAN